MTNEIKVILYGTITVLVVLIAIMAIIYRADKEVNYDKPVVNSGDDFGGWKNDDDDFNKN